MPALRGGTRLTQALSLARTFLLDMLRQKTVVFSCFVLPAVIIWSTWWVTADLAMEFKIDSGPTIQASMIDIHLVTGALTGMAITAGLFSFLVTAEARRVADRLRVTGFSPLAVATGPLAAILLVLGVAALAAFGLAASLDMPEQPGGVLWSVLLTTLVYAAVGALLATLYPRVMEGSFIVLLLSFIDLMFVSNPMGEGVYMRPWAYWSPGFWPAQIALESGFLASDETLAKATGLSLLYTLCLGLLVLALRWRSPAFLRRAVGGA